MLLLRNALIDLRYRIFLLLIGMISTANAQTDSLTSSYHPPGLDCPGQLVDIGGWRLHLFGQGTGHSEGPTVIFESGAGGFSFDWSLVQPKVAAFARAYTYDRAGSAWSELGPRPHTMHQTVYELHTMLQRAGIPGPYVLVGASYGGILVRLFARQYPNEVAGMVLVDSGLENSQKYVDGKPVRASEIAPKPIQPVKKRANLEDTQLATTPEARKFLDHVLSRAGINITSPKLNPDYQKLPEFAQNFRLWATCRYEYYAANDNNAEIHELADMIAYQKDHPQYLEAIPLIVLTRGPDGASESSPVEAERKQSQAALQNLSSNSKQIIADKSGHHIEVDDPNLVTTSVLEVVEAVRKNARLVR